MQEIVCAIIEIIIQKLHIPEDVAGATIMVDQVLLVRLLYDSVQEIVCAIIEIQKLHIPEDVAGATRLSTPSTC